MHLTQHITTLMQGGTGRDGLSIIIKKRAFNSRPKMKTTQVHRKPEHYYFFNLLLLNGEDIV